MSEFLLRGLRDPRLAAHAIAPQGAWLWASDGTRLFWANAAGAALFEARSIPDLLARSFDDANPLRLQTIQLAARLPQSGAARLERLRGFGAPLGQLTTCSCARLVFTGGVTGILVIAAAPQGRMLPLAARIAGLTEGVGEPLALFAGNGKLAAANEAGRQALGPADSLAAAGLSAPRDALEQDGRAEAVTERARFSLFRLGTGAETATAAIIAPFPLRSITTRIGDAVVEPHELGVDGRPVLSEAQAPTHETPVIPTPPAADPNDPDARPQRFVWQADADGRFSVTGERFAALIGPAALDRPWSEIAVRIDRDGRLAQAIASGETFSNIATIWMAEDGAQIEAALSGLPVFDAARNVAGYRGFGLYRSRPRPQAELPPPPPAIIEPPPRPVTPVAGGNDTAANVLRFPSPEPRSPVLSATENCAFDELARQLSARLESVTAAPSEPETISPETIAPPPEPPKTESPKAEPRAISTAASRGDIERPLLDRLPLGILVYRFDRLLYANPAFLTQTGHASLNALTDAGGLDALYIEPGVAAADSHSDAGTPLTLSRPQSGDSPLDARLFAISWDGDSAMALVLGPRGDNPLPAAAPEPLRDPEADDIRRERDALRAILDVTTDGIVVIDGEKRVVACNRSAEALFGRSDAELGGTAFAELFAPESQHDIAGYADGICRADGASLLGHGREALGRVAGGNLIPLSLTMGRTPGDGHIFAMFRDLSQTHAVEAELAAARRQSERAAGIKSDVLGKVSHDIRAPLSSIIGFAELMIEERFGPLGNPRYITYLKDIRASGERVVKLVDDLADLSRIETGKIDLTFTAAPLNELIEQCVALMQPQANRERIIIRSSLAHGLPQVTADAGVLRQIVLNLITTSIKLNSPGGQVIVSTALTDHGDVALRIRDTGAGLSSSDLAAALEPYRADKAQEQSSSTGIGLSLTRALVEANRAHFDIRSAPQSGTLIEVMFSAAQAR